MNWNNKIKKTNLEREDEEQDQRYCEAESAHSNSNPQQNQQDEEQSEDPLDAFMQDFQQVHKKQLKPTRTQRPTQTANQKRETQRRDFGYDESEEYPMQGDSHSQHTPNQVKERDEQFMDDADGREQQAVESGQNRKIIAPLQPVDFTKIHLQDFEKNFYSPHEDILNMSSADVKKLQKEYEIKATGTCVPNPIVSFGHLPLTDRMMKIITSQGFERPTPIQSQALPCAFSGRDIVGIAKTGSGKTYAFVWPMIVHVLHQKRSQKGEGPVALILAPTRELCQQIFVEAKRYGRKQDMRIESLLGGQNKHDQWKRLKAGVDILIASPGRLIEFVRKKATNLLRVTYLVLDEADRMMSLGFQQQIRSIVSQTRQDRQTLLFTATMKKSMQMLVGDIVSSPIRITVGDQSSANQDVKQEVVIVKEDQEKVEWLERNIFHLLIEGKILIFVNQRVQSEELGQYLENLFVSAYKTTAIKVLVLHGDKNQYERTTIMNQFKKENGQIMVATEVAARGIDVKNVKTVINFECPKNIEAYIHRIGRAGRAGETGTAYTFLTPKDVKFAISLVGVFQNSGYPVPEELEDMSMWDEGFKRKRIASKMGVSFAKGKDATKYLNHALKRQRRGNSRAGLGMQYDESKRKYTKKEEEASLNLSKETERLGYGASISQVSRMIRQKVQQQEQQIRDRGLVGSAFSDHFVKATKNDMEQEYSQSTITYFSKKTKKAHAASNADDGEGKSKDDS